MATAALPQYHQSTPAAQQIRMFSAAALAAAASTPSSGNTPSPICSTPLTMFSAAGYHPLAQYVQPPNGQYIQPAAVQPSVTNVFEGVPIFLAPQCGSGSSAAVFAATVSFAALQRASELKANWSSRSHSPKVDTSKHFHVFVGDLAAEVDSSALKAAFNSFGEISDVKVIRDSQTLKSKGYGFVSFPVKESAEKAIEEMNGQMIGRRQIRTNWAIRRVATSEENAPKAHTFDEVFNATHSENTSVYVGGISTDTTEEDLMKSFSRTGTVSEVRLFKQQGYAFVRYTTKEAATRAILSMNGKEVNGQKIRCSWGRTPTDTNAILNQTQGSVNMLASNLLGFNQLVSPMMWNPNHYLSQFYGQPLLHPWQT